MYRKICYCIQEICTPRTFGLLCSACFIVVLVTRNSFHTSVREIEVRQLIEDEVSVLCASSIDDDGYKRWSKSAALWGARGEPLGRNRTWGGFGTKLNLLKEKLAEMMIAGRERNIVIYTDSHDVVFVGDVREVVTRFTSRGDADNLFAAEMGCWPDNSARSRYPPVTGYPYLNAGALIGQVRVVSEPDSWPYVENTFTGSRPLILHGNGPGKDALWTLASSLVRGWTQNIGQVPDKVPRML